MAKVLVIQTAFIGDAVLTLPMIQEIKKKENAQLDVLCIPSTEEIFSASSYVDSVIVYDKRGKDKGIRNTLKLAKFLKNSGYSKIISPHRSLRTSFLVALTQVRETFGFDNSSLSHVYRHLKPYNIHKHEVERNLNLAGYNVKGQLSDYLPEVNFDQHDLVIQQYLSENKINSFVIVAPSSVWATKRYPDNYFIELIDYLYTLNLQVVLTGSKNDFNICRQIAEKSRNKVFNSAGKFSIIETIALISKAGLLISNDSAPTHFGLCTKTPVITIYCSTIPEFGFYPYKKNSIFFSIDDLICKPCGIHGYDECPLKTFECGYRLRPETIIEKIPLLLNETN